MCENDGVVVGFEFPEPLENPERATVRSIPGQRENVPVLPVTDRIVRITGNGIVTALSLIREAAAFHVRVRGASASFSTSGSRHIVDGCFTQQEARFGGAITPGDRAVWGTGSRNTLDPR